LEARVSAAEVEIDSLYMLSDCHLCVCLSSVCNVRAPYSGDWNFQ